MTEILFYHLKGQSLEQVLPRENEIIDRMRRLSMVSMQAERIRCGGGGQDKYPC